MLGYFTRFAASGDPNGDAAVVWPAYDAATDPYLELGDPVRAGTKLRESHCDFWASL